MVLKIYYYGCVGRVGHCLFDSNLEYVRGVRPESIPWPFLDGALAPHHEDCTFNDVIDSQGHIRAFCSSRTGQPRLSCNAVEGLAKLHNRRDGNGEYWTALAFWDCSVDERPGSNSVFILEGLYNFEQALEIAKKTFPTIFKRFKFEIKEKV